MSFDAKKYSKTISGSSAYEGLGSYEIDEAVEKKFGDDVCVDSEHSCVFIYATEAVADEVIAYVREIGKEGELYHTYGAGSFVSEFTMYDTIN